MYESLELFQYPFDYQFLNLKLTYDVKKFKLIRYDNITALQKIKEFLPESQLAKKSTTNQGINKDRQLITAYIKESLVDDISMYGPYIDTRLTKKYEYTGFRVTIQRLLDQCCVCCRESTDVTYQNAGCLCTTQTLNPNVPYSLIRLRVSTNPWSIIVGILLPFFGIVLLSFITFFFDDESFGDRIAIPITLLLTFAAFQGAVKQYLPDTCNILYIDIYIIVSYFIQFVIIAETWVIQNLSDDKEKSDTDYITGLILGILLFIVSFYYISFGCRRNWKRRSFEEIQHFHHSFNAFSFHGVGLDLNKDIQKWEVL